MNKAVIILSELTLSHFSDISMYWIHQVLNPDVSFARQSLNRIFFMPLLMDILLLPEELI